MRIGFLVFLFFLSIGQAMPDEIVKPIRGPVPIPEVNPSESYRTEKHDQYVPRSHRWQPPVIPHHVKGYQITRNVNTCMTCHSRKAAEQTGARPVAKSHYLDRDGKELPSVSARRYFCLQCHVPQFDARPLVGNSFEGPKSGGAE
jgi:nitrate reductase (cytochrome), electron transfer subunit